MDDLTRLHLRGQLELDEGRRNRMYWDEIGKVWTIGVGHNLSSRSISNRAVDTIFEDDLLETEKELVAGLPWVTDLAPARYGVLIDIAFNCGVAGLMGFHKMLAACQRGDWDDAAREIIDSELEKNRAQRLARQMRSGVW
jgi:lysozyme